jgi:cellulose synthase/poly-beta-1,6-N-acetylglucosamine synthase-like glycosyltransferase
MGKRRGINNAVRHATSEVIVSVDSDVVVDPRAVRELVKHFTSDEIAAVGGRVHVLNANDNWLSRMQAIKYWFGYEYLKNVERWFGSVMCLSGCLTAYRRSVLMELEPILETRNLLGVPIKYGEDRFLTRQIVKAGYKTTMTLQAQCHTMAPTTLTSYFNQQLRWRRSNIVDMIGGVSHAWSLHPVVGIHYLSLFAMLFSYPLVIFQSLVSGTFWSGALLHAALLAGLGCVYWFQTRNDAACSRIHPLWFVAMTLVMPITYLIATPLAMFTLHSSSWETRGHQGADEPTLDLTLVQQAVQAPEAEPMEPAPAASGTYRVAASALPESGTHPVAPKAAEANPMSLAA